MLFKVISKYDTSKHPTVYKVYAVSTDKYSPKFLLYKDGEWNWEYACIYKPIDEILDEGSELKGMV